MTPRAEDPFAWNNDRLATSRIYSWQGMLWLLVALLLGCGKPAEERTAVVLGTVTLEGAPLEAGTVLFMTEGGHAASESLAPDGSYTVRCRPDRYKVAVTPPPPPDPLGIPAGAAASRMPPSGKPIPKRYQDLGSSGLTVEAKKGNNRFDISMRQ
jgi:hypothetical protein